MFSYGETWSILQMWWVTDTWYVNVPEPFWYRNSQHDHPCIYKIVSLFVCLWILCFQRIHLELLTCNHDNAFKHCIYSGYKWCILLCLLPRLFLEEGGCMHELFQCNNLCKGVFNTSTFVPNNIPWTTLLLQCL